MADGPDMENRDPNNINDHLQVVFEDVFAEPDHAHSLDCVWRNSYKCFNCTKNCCYLALTTLCSIFVAFCWACEFATLTFYHVWYVTPCFKVCEIELGCCKKFYSLCMRCALDPLCEACGLLFSAFKK
ncbi:caveolin-3-like [Lineus longissimus]|uniref:caveolin-3-like n=1 Tax=Lineus longissimus TaxID=88925 RepID=UPI002B4EBAED